LGVPVESIYFNPPDDALYVRVPAGPFSMGSTPGDVNIEDDETPAHWVNLDSYWIMQTEVTNAMYAKCVRAGMCQTPRNWSSATRSSYYGNSTYDSYPVVYTTWNDAEAYCHWVGGRLPTEAEWEKAARGTDGRTYPWGESLDCSKANYYPCKKGDATKVGSYPSGASLYGALDMAGNVLEWVADWYDGTYYSNSPNRNPSGLASGKYLVLRGGSWYSFDWDVRSAYRYWSSPGSRGSNVGFRCVRSP
jgi:formylglycine-generating enzyme required for sulfatase activity